MRTCRFRHEIGSGRVPLPPALGLLLTARLTLLAGCGTAPVAQRDSGRAPTVLVGPFTMEVAISHSSKIYSFDEPPSPEQEPDIRKRLIADATFTAQQLMTDRLGRQKRFSVLPLHEAERLEATVAPLVTVARERILAMGRVAGADLVLFGRLLGYGQMPLRYWLTFWAITASSQLTVVGAVSGCNSVAMGSYLLFDIMTDLPIWTGGFYAFGWAFRPVLIEVEVWQLTGCEQEVWKVREFALLGHKYLETYPEHLRKKKEVQLEANLTRAIEELAELASRTLTMQPCPQAP